MEGWEAEGDDVKREREWRKGGGEKEMKKEAGGKEDKWN